MDAWRDTKRTFLDISVGSGQWAMNVQRSDGGMRTCKIFLSPARLMSLRRDLRLQYFCCWSCATKPTGSIVASGHQGHVLFYKDATTTWPSTMPRTKL